MHFAFEIVVRDSHLLDDVLETDFILAVVVWLAGGARVKPVGRTGFIQQTEALVVSLSSGRWNFKKVLNFSTFIQEGDFLVVNFNFEFMQWR